MPSKPIQRERIPWYPSLDEAKCNGCQVCFRFCQHGVYTWDEKTNTAKVTRPFSCIVGCSGCLSLCPVGAISFPDIDAVNEVIQKLREE
ncbi:MAG: ferredoxin family protein [Candidatus Aminicenantes bacterium]|nr:ferredoxin family protein [Candidatus Aminicenantes bacterium]